MTVAPRRQLDLSRWLGNHAVESIADRLRPLIDASAVTKFEVAGRAHADLPFLRRRDRLAVVLHDVLSRPFNDASDIIVGMLPGPRQLPGYGGWAGCWLLVLSRYVSLYGLDEPQRSFFCLAEITRRFSSEFDVRPFLNAHQQLTLKVARAWTKSHCQHVRRLATESLRPRLPWAPKIAEFERDPTPILQLCDALVDDDSRYVLRSVANTVADVYKANPEIALSKLRTYLEEPSVKRKWLIKHALRYPLRKGDARAARLLRDVIKSKD
jgi:3-methyladenine DNA glycosylase AlkC